MKKKLLVTFIAACLALPILALSPETPMLPSQEVRVVSMNLSVETQRMYERGPEMMKLIRSCDPDSIGPQETGYDGETDWLAYFEKYFPDYTRVGLSGDGNEVSRTTCGEYVFFKTDKYECVDWETMWVAPVTRQFSSSLKGTYPRTLTWAILKNRTTGFMYVHINTHLAFETAEENEFQMNIVSSLADRFASEGLPVFVTGDFNTSEGSNSYNMMVSKPEMGDPKYLADKTMYYGTWRGWEYRDLTGARPIDFCFVAKNKMHVNEYRVLNTYEEGGIALSDHNGIYVSVTVDSLPDPMMSPAFSVDDDISVTEVSRRSYVYDIEFSRDKGKERIYKYTAELYDSRGMLQDKRVIHTYIFDQTVPDSYRCTFTCLEPDTEYTVIIHSHSVSGRMSDGYRIDFRTAPLIGDVLN